MVAPGISPRLIGLCGAAGSGKSEVAAILAEYGFTRLKFAAALKAMLGTLLAAGGVANEDIRRMIEGDLKETPAAILGGTSPRHAMQTLGTEWGRDCIAVDLWVRLVIRRAEAILAAGGKVVVEDMRFLNEAAACRGVLGDHPRGARQVWRIAGRGGIAGGHVSEGQALGHDVTLDNAGDLAALRAQVAALI